MRWLDGSVTSQWTGLCEKSEDSEGQKSPGVLQSRGHKQSDTTQERMTTIMHELTHIEFPSVLGTVLCAGDTLAVKRTDKESCSP